MIAGGVGSTTAADVQSLALVPFILKFLGRAALGPVQPAGLGTPQAVHRARDPGRAVAGPGRACRSSIPGGTSRCVHGAGGVTVTGLAFYDTCCDGMVIDVTPPADRDRVQGMLVASRAAAAMLCSLGFGLVLEATGNGPGRGDTVLWICAGLGLIPLALALAVCRARAGRRRRALPVAGLGVLVRPAVAGAAGVRGVLRPRRLRGRDQPQPVLRPESRARRRDDRRPGLGAVRRAGRRRGAACRSSAAPRPDAGY